MNKELKRKMKKVLTLFIGTLVIVVLGKSRLYGAGIGLEFPLSARCYALGEALVANAKPASCALFFNPAGLALLEERFLSFFYDDGLLDAFYNNVSYGQKVKDKGLCVGLGILNGGRVTIYEFDGTEKSISSQNDII